MLLSLVCFLIATVTFAHETPVPHAHLEETHNLLTWLQWLLFVAIFIWAITKLYKYFQRAKQA